jgi:hypothetical protein
VGSGGVCGDGNVGFAEVGVDEGCRKGLDEWT